MKKSSTGTQLAAEVAQLVAELVAMRTPEAENACYRWGARSMKHRLELLRTLRTWTRLDGLKTARLRKRIAHRRSRTDSPRASLVRAAGFVGRPRKLLIEKSPTIRILSSLRIHRDLDVDEDE